MTPILLALAYTAMDQGEWGVAVGIAMLGVAQLFSVGRKYRLHE